MNSSSHSAFTKASWISGWPLGGPRSSAPVPYLRKAFKLTQPIRSAQLAITALGLYECEINGVRVGDHVLAPGWSDYRRRVYYQIHDVTVLMREGENALGVILGDGWYCGSVAMWGRQAYGKRPQLLAQLEITYNDGSTMVVATDLSWKTTTGPILEGDLLMGETYDARLELGAWSEPGYDDKSWDAVLPAEDPAIVLAISPAPPMRRIEEVKPVSGPNQSVFDLGQNFSGRVRISLEAPRGTTFTLRFAEMLNSHGHPYTANLRAARATDYYTCKGGGVETWEPRFTFHGFRYVEVKECRPEYKIQVTGIVLYSDMKRTGHFSCSNPLLNQLQSNIVWGQKSNFLDVPTDCPQRDERMGWTGDAQVFVRTAAFNMDVHGFFAKWMQDLRDSQLPEGFYPCTAPAFDPAFASHTLPASDGGPGWSDATFICPWTIYLCYGDPKILEDHYDSMERYMQFLARERCLGHIRSHPDVDSWGGFGDWLALDGSGKLDGATPRDLIATAFYAYAADIMSRTAKILGRADDVKKYDILRGEIVEAFRRRFVTPEGLMASGTQTSYVLALHFGLLPEEVRATAIRELVRDIERREFHLATGFIGTPYLLEVLETNGYPDIAYKLLEQETFPSWLFPVKNGATTIWERWDGWTPDKGFQSEWMNSFNHYAYGCVGAWMVRSVAGLELDPENPAYRHIIFRPRPGGSLTWAEARLETVHGEAAIRWELEKETLKLNLTVPLGTRATFLPPPGYATEKQTLEPGRHALALKKKS